MTTSPADGFKKVLEFILRAPKWFALCLIRFYQSCISPRYPACCRFRPTCSQYAVLAIEKFGVLKGSWLAFKRILRCNPLNPGGYDPVPDVFVFIGNRRQ